MSAAAASRRPEVWAAGCEHGDGAFGCIDDLEVLERLSNELLTATSREQLLPADLALA